MMNILLIGSGAREHAIAKAIKRSPQPSVLFCFGSNWNPGIRDVTEAYTVGSMTDIDAVSDFARTQSIDFAIIGPEAPLEAGLADALWENEIPCVGPLKQLAQLETSKAFTRNLLAQHGIQASPEYKIFNAMDGVSDFLQKLDNQYVVKYDGLMGGKGVKVAGDHLHSRKEALAYCRELVDSGRKFIIEEKLVGQEFSLMSFCDGSHLVHMPPVQDHKRAFIGDKGPNTGGMGSYSDANHLLPFLTEKDIQQAQAINVATATALKNEFGMGYKGIIYGGFMVTGDGVKLVEYNARFGDPEGMNVLAILESDFVAICQAVVDGTLNRLTVKFGKKATVCKYAVPAGYPDDPVKNQPIDVSAVKNIDQLYYASVDTREGKLYEMGSRTAAFVGIADNLEAAEAEAEVEICRVKGPLFHREDIGTAELIRLRVEHINTLRRRY